MTNKYLKIIYILSVLLVINIIVLFFILFPLKSEVSDWSGDIITLQTEIQSLNMKQRNAAQELEAIKLAGTQIAGFKDEVLGRRNEKIKKIMETIDDLVYRFRLNKTRVNYSPVKIDSEMLEKMKIQFAVRGDYDSLRYFINSIEKSDLFLTLETLSLKHDVSSTEAIQLNIVITTYFKKEII